MKEIQKCSNISNSKSRDEMNMGKDYKEYIVFAIINSFV